MLHWQQQDSVCQVYLFVLDSQKSHWNAPKISNTIKWFWNDHFSEHLSCDLTTADIEAGSWLTWTPTYIPWLMREESDTLTAPLARCSVQLPGARQSRGVWMDEAALIEWLLRAICTGEPPLLLLVGVVTAAQHPMKFKITQPLKKNVMSQVWCVW